MSNQPDPVRQNIRNWCNADNIPCVDGNQSPNMDWCLMLNNRRIAVFKLTRFADRIYFQTGINVAPAHQQMIRENNQIRNNILLQIPTLIIQLGHDPRITQANNTITVINLSKIHFHTTISKAEFLSIVSRLINVHQLVLNQLSVTLQTTLAQLQQTPITPDASDVGIG